MNGLFEAMIVQAVSTARSRARRPSAVRQKGGVP